MQNRYVNETADSFRQIHTSTQNISQQVTHLRETVDIVTDENCSINLDSVANVAVVMDNLSLEAAKLQN